MNSESNINSSSNQKNKVALKLDWIFGIRKDIMPNIFLLDSDTIVYLAGHYIVIYNFTKKVPQNQYQQFIQGIPQSKGFSTINIANFQKKYIATAEELNDGVVITIYTLINHLGTYNIPLKVTSTFLYDIRVTKVYHLAFSQREEVNNYFAVVGLAEEPCLILWRWEGDALKEKLVYTLKLPAVNYQYLQISFSFFKNDCLCLVSDKFFIYYTISNKSLNVTQTFMEPQYGSVLSHCWFYEGNFSITTERAILIFDNNFKILQTIDTWEEDTKSHITFILPLMDSFIAVGKNKRFEVYDRKSDLYELSCQKVFNDNERVDKMEKEKTWDFLCLTNTKNASEQLIIAATTNNDLVQIDLKEIDKTDKQVGFKHLIAPFHSDSVEGLDICINKPYVITCSKDKNLRVWDYKRRNLVLSRFCDEEMYSVAFHPSGMHAIVSFEDKIMPMNIYYDEIYYMTQNGIAARKSKDVKQDFKFLDKIFKWRTIFRF